MSLPPGIDALALYEAIRAKSDKRWRVWDTLTVGELLHVADAAFYDKDNNSVTVSRMLLADHRNIRVSLVLLSPPESASFEELQDTSNWNVAKTTMFTNFFSTAMLEAMFFSGAVEPSYDAKAKVLQIGIGGGGMYNFTESAFPNIELTGVELSAVMVETAKKWFQLKTTDTQKCFVGDGIAFLASAVEKGEKYDAILVDATYCGFKDAGDDEFLAPVPPFREVAFFECAKKALTPTGCLVFNVYASGGDDATPAVAKKFEESLHQVFPYTSTVLIDGNGAVSGSNHATPDRDGIRKRIEALDFKFVDDLTGGIDEII